MFWSAITLFVSRTSALEKVGSPVCCMLAATEDSKDQHEIGGTG